MAKSYVESTLEGVGLGRNTYLTLPIEKNLPPDIVAVLTDRTGFRVSVKVLIQKFRKKLERDLAEAFSEDPVDVNSLHRLPSEYSRGLLVFLDKSI